MYVCICFTLQCRCLSCSKLHSRISKKCKLSLPLLVYSYSEGKQMLISMQTTSYQQYVAMM